MERLFIFIEILIFIIANLILLNIYTIVKSLEDLMNEMQTFKTSNLIIRKGE